MSWRTLPNLNFGSFSFYANAAEVTAIAMAPLAESFTTLGTLYMIPGIAYDTMALGKIPRLAKPEKWTFFGEKRHVFGKMNKLLFSFHRNFLFFYQLNVHQSWQREKTNFVFKKIWIEPNFFFIIVLIRQAQSNSYPVVVTVL